MAILKCKNIYRAFDTAKNFIPLFFMLVNRYSILVGKISGKCITIFFAGNIRTDKSRKIVGNLFAESSHLRIYVDNSGKCTAYFLIEIPSLESRTLAIHIPNFFYYTLIDLNLFFRLSIMPVVTGIVSTEVEPNIMFFS